MAMSYSKSVALEVHSIESPFFGGLVRPCFSHHCCMHLLSVEVSMCSSEVVLYIG